MAKAITQIKVTVKSVINPSVIETKDGKRVKIPSNVESPSEGDEITVNSDWVIDAKAVDAQKPVPVAEPGTTDDVKSDTK